QWGRDVAPGPDVVAVRQNLQLIVDGGQPVPGLTTNANGAWGSTKNQLQYTWRSGIGVTANGSLVYVGGANMNLAALAAALTEAGAVRGMQLDIHDNMVDLFTYRHDTGGLTPRKLLPDMPGPDTRYLVPDQRDFVAVTLR
ncbi:MAG: phosphodiester glycosidase family protein, partial [Actinomycetota bacterium]|nr:phosphodiester glycosidase family protein [Actinomycetota bacterium]